MAPNKVCCCCIPYRLATLLFLIFFFLYNLGSVYVYFKIMEHPMYKDSMKDYSYRIIYLEIFVGFIASLFLLAAIVSVITKKFYTYFLNVVILVLFLNVIFSIISCVLSSFDDTVERYDIVLDVKEEEEDDQSDPLPFRREISINHQPIQGRTRKYRLAFVKIAVILFAIRVFRTFIVQSEENSVDDEIANV